MLDPQLPSVSRLPWRRAFVESLLATLLCVVVVGIAFMPKEMDRLRAKPIERVLFCAPTPDGKSIYSLVASINMEEVDMGQTTRLVRCDLSPIAVTSRVVCSNLKPKCAILDASGQRLFVGDTRGFIIATGLKQPSKSDALLGHVLRGFPERMACTRDERSLMLQNHFGLFSWNIDMRSPEFAFPRWCHVDGSIGCFAVYPDSHRAVFSRTTSEGAPSQQSDLFEVDIQTGEFHLLYNNIGRRLINLAISPNSEFLVGVEDAGDVALLERRSSREPLQPCSIPGLNSGLSGIACFSPDSKLLITSDRDTRRLIVWDLDRKEMRSQFEMHPTRVMGCDFLNDGQLLSWSFDTTLRVWNLNRATLVRQINVAP